MRKWIQPMRRRSRRVKCEVILLTIYRYLRIFGDPRGHHLSSFGNLVRQDIPDATDTEILSVLRRMYWTGRGTLSKFVRFGPFFNLLGKLLQGALFFASDELEDSEGFFCDQFLCCLRLHGD